MPPSPIFIHALYRSCSTWWWKQFRDADGYHLTNVHDDLSAYKYKSYDEELAPSEYILRALCG